jgi:hypothetical protein
MPDDPTQPIPTSDIPKRKAALSAEGTRAFNHSGGFPSPAAGAILNRQLDLEGATAGLTIPAPGKDVRLPVERRPATRPTTRRATRSRR